MKQLIINADDFGLHTAVNEGIIQGYTAGCVTSTSLMSVGEAFDHGVSLLAQQPRLGVGIHLTLVGERALTDAGKIPSLVDRDGNLSSNYLHFLFRFFRGGVRLEDIRRELRAQVHKGVATGLAITHLDSHQHIHVAPGIIDIVLDLAREFHIKAVRIPDEPFFFLGKNSVRPARVLARDGLTFLARLARKKARKQGVAVPGHFYGMLSGGGMDEQLWYISSMVYLMGFPKL